MTLLPYPYRSRARWGETTVAESDACLILERDGEPAFLYFPRGDIDLAAFQRVGTASAVPEGGEAEVWGGASARGEEVLTIVTSPPAGLEALRDFGRFDTERIRVEVLDGTPGGDARDLTIKRFPTWGDTAHLVDLLDVRPGDDLSYVASAHTDGRRPVVEGSQMLGQAIVAAGRHAPGRRVVSATMLFLRGAHSGRPLRFELDELSAGRTFTGLGVRVVQDDKCCAAGTLLLDVTAEGLLSHEAEAPEVPGPYECPAFDMSVTGRDLRVVDAAYTNAVDAPPGPPVIDCWVRFRDLPDDQALHAGLLAQFTGHMPIAAAMRPHEGIGQDQAHRTLSTGINAITISFHRDVHADEWMLYHHESTFAGDGMTHAECRVFAERGHLLASFVVDAMVRAFPSGDGTRDERTAL